MRIIYFFCFILIRIWIEKYDNFLFLNKKQAKKEQFDI